MCGFDKKLTECSYDELKHYRLAKSDEKIPLFDEVLKVIDGKVPLIVEVKSEGDWKKTTQRAWQKERLIEIFTVAKSFHPFAVKWFKDHRPEIIRGQLSTNYFKDKINRKWYEKFLLSNLIQIFLLQKPISHWCITIYGKRIFPILCAENFSNRRMLHGP